MRKKELEAALDACERKYEREVAHARSLLDECEQQRLAAEAPPLTDYAPAALLQAAAETTSGVARALIHRALAELEG